MKVCHPTTLQSLRQAYQKCGLCCCTSNQNLLPALKVMRLSSREASSSIAFATLFTIGQFRLVGTPIRSSVTNHSASSYSTSSESKTENPTEISQEQPKMSDSLQRAKDGAVWGMLIADALSMPVHWYYNPADIKSGYGGWLTGYRAPEKNHPSSILTLSAVDGSGRTGWHEKSKTVIGNVILHDKLKYWTSGKKSTHYHQGMKAGDNTLNSAVEFMETMQRVDPYRMKEVRGIVSEDYVKFIACMKAGDNTLNSVIAVEFMETLHRVDPNFMKEEEEVRGIVLEDYVKFMTTPGSHNDTYCESFHRSFFKDWVLEDKQPKTASELLQFTKNRFQRKTREGSDSQLVSIGALIPAIPWILRNAHKSEDECAHETMEFIKCTHPVTALIPFVDIYSRLLQAVLKGSDLRQEVLKVLSHSELGGPGKREGVLRLLDKAASFPKGSEKRLQAYQYATQMLGSACYIEGALSSLLFLAYEFADDFEAGVLANANCGGENCHRGAALGALLGAAAIGQGKTIPQNLIDGLNIRPEVIKLLHQNNSL